MVELPTHLRGGPLGKTKVSRAELSSHQRDRVIAKATPVFARRGYQPTSVDDLLAAAKVGVGNFYSLFEGKEDCFLACLDRAIAEGRERLAEALSGVEGWEERSYLGLAAMLGHMAEDPSAVRLVLVEAQSAGTEAAGRHRAILAEAADWLAEGRRGHAPAKALPPSFEEATVAGLAFYLEQCLLRPEGLSPEELLEETASLLLEPMLGAKEFAGLVSRLSPRVQV
jgi:AcrR family transcriptional regulator